MKRFFCVSLIVALVITSCRDLRRPDSYKTNVEIAYEEAWTKTLGEVDPEQTWENSSYVTVDIKGVGESEVKIYSLGQEKRSLLAETHVDSDASISFNMPQGLEKGISICVENEDGVQYRHLSKSSLSSGRASVNFAEAGTKAGTAISNANKAALTKPTLVNPLTGKRAKIYGYTNFPAWIWADMNEAIPENKSAVISKQITNFELQSNGIFYISTIYGSTGNSSVEVGYYYYDKADPSNITFIPLIDALDADYYYDDLPGGVSKENALPKVEWLRNDTWQWTPANFCYYDQVDGMKGGNFTTRKGDDQFNTLSVHKFFGHEDPDKSTIAQIRGLTFQIDAPVGNMVGFYCKKPNQTPNHTTSSLNRNNYHAAAIKVYDGFRFIGLEDGTSTGSTEPDCNDIAFVMVSGNNGTLPGLLLPYIQDKDDDKYYNGDGTKTEEPKFDVATDGKDEQYEDLANKKQVWTLAFEDMSTIGDFDFNDVVLVIDPYSKTGVADVYLAATGGTLNSYIYYEDTLLGEAHQLLGSVENGKNVIANTYEQKYKMKKIYTIKLGNVAAEAAKFKVVAGNNVITFPKIGEVPKALCVAGLWSWPKESSRVDHSYPLFRDWGMDFNNEKFKDWYEKPDHDKIVKF